MATLQDPLDARDEVSVSWWDRPASPLGGVLAGLLGVGVGLAVFSWLAGVVAGVIS